MSKQYGLILPNKEPKRAAPMFTANRNVFGDDSDDEDNVKVSQIPVNTGEKSKRQAKVIQSKVLEEDPTVYQYDELYEDISAERNKKQLRTAKGGEEKKSRYIGKLLETAEKRKKEYERRVERQIQKEREEEGDKFADKESFVTSAYKKKLEEMREEEEREQREKYLEEIGDVTKQADLGGFYRHLYEQQLRPEKQRPDIHKPKVDIKKESEESPSKVKSSDEKQSETESDEETKKPKKTGDVRNINKEKRTYRKRKTSVEEENKSDQSDTEEINKITHKDVVKKPKHDEQNPDADSDFSIDESSSESEGEIKEKSNKVKKKPEKDVEKAENIKTEVVDKDSDSPKDVASDSNKDLTAVQNGDKKDDGEFKKPDIPAVKNEKPVEVKPKVDIWKKRTVGEVFDQAVERYYQRKAARGY